MLRLFTTFYLLFVFAFFVYEATDILFTSPQVREIVTADMWSDHEGALYLVDQLEKNVSPELFDSILLAYPADANMPMKLITANELNLGAEDRERLKANLLHRGNFDEGLFFYRQLENERLIEYGPMGEMDEVEALEDILLFVSLLYMALPLAVGLYFLAAKIKRLNLAAMKLGQGVFSTRVSDLPRHRIGRLNETFNLMAERIERLIAGHKNLTNAVAHELRTPVSRIRFQLDMLFEEQNEERKTEYMFGISDDVHELANLLDELLSYARFDRDDQRPVLSLHSLDESLNAVVAAREFEADIKVIYDRRYCQEAQILLPFDPQFFQRAIGNLLGNAQKYATKQIQLNVELNELECSICVDDDGPGIPETNRLSIFEPFARLDTSRTRSTGGYGLGLAIVKQLALWHRGSVKVETSPLGGARFRFTLPISQT